MAILEIKTCTNTKCKTEKPIAEFYKDKNACDGLRSQCKACMNAASSKWHADNPERARAISYAYYSANIEKVRATTDAWQSLNRYKVREATAAWAKANPENRRINEHNRRARKRVSGGNLSPDLAVRLYKLQKGKCACCGKKLGDNYHLDHIIPIVLGGSNTDDNIQLLRARCNLQKHAKHPIDFMQQKGFLL